ncbi:hypothetical protein H8356DRAFT_1346848 [Neocallimastix lanati (nom. inval.)]|nr:hypothetical protein H8356DRAFT_1346848 [Neocallimastix sp. JGI-2020a]
MTDSAECFDYKGSNFKIILKAKDLHYYVTSNIFNETNNITLKTLVLKCLSDLLNIFNKLKNANYDINENDKIQYMFKALLKELKIAFLTKPATEIQATDKTISKEKELPINFVTSVKTYLTNDYFSLETEIGPFPFFVGAAMKYLLGYQSFISLFITTLGEWFLFRCLNVREYNPRQMCNDYASISHYTVLSVMVIIRDRYSLCRLLIDVKLDILTNKLLVISNLEMGTSNNNSIIKSKCEMGLDNN